jgi:hypothetical protein
MFLDIHSARTSVHVTSFNSVIWDRSSKVKNSGAGTMYHLVHQRFVGFGMEQPAQRIEPKLLQHLIGDQWQLPDGEPGDEALLVDAEKAVEPRHQTGFDEQVDSEQKVPFERFGRELIQILSCKVG